MLCIQNLMMSKVSNENIFINSFKKENTCLAIGIKIDSLTLKMPRQGRVTKSAGFGSLLSIFQNKFNFFLR